MASKLIKYSIIAYAVLLIHSCKDRNVYKEYYDNGNLKHETTYVNGIEDGKTKTYYENGQLKTEAIVVNGKLNDWVKTYYQDGSLLEKYYCKDDSLHGKYYKYFPTKNINVFALYEMGEKVYEERYNEKGGIINKYRKLSIDSKSDTIYVGELFRATILLAGPLDSTQIKVFTGNAFLTANKADVKLKEIEYKGEPIEISYTGQTPGKYAIPLIWEERCNNEQFGLSNPVFFWVINKKES